MTERDKVIEYHTNALGERLRLAIRAYKAETAMIANLTPGECAEIVKKALMLMEMENTIRRKWV